MIVTCPACRSRYRCGDRSEPGATAHCSSCDERFPLTAQRKSYRVMQAASTLSATMAVTAVQRPGGSQGVDEQGPGPDPLLEGRPPETRIDLQFGGSGYGAAADTPVPEPIATAPLAPPEAPEAPEAREAREARETFEAGELIDTVPDAVSEEIEGPAAEFTAPRARMPQTVGELLVALVPASLGGVVAYYFAGLFQQSPVLCAALGSLVGLLFGWACLLWITRDD